MSKIIEFPKSKQTQVLATFKDFYFQTMTGDLVAAAKTLESLFGVDGYTARRYVDTYKAKSLVDPTLTMKTLEIKTAIDNGNKIDALVLIQYCFDISIVEAVVIFSTLSKY